MSRTIVMRSSLTRCPRPSWPRCRIWLGIRVTPIHSDESRNQGLDRLELIRFLQVAQTITVHHGALAHLLGINALRASEAAAVRIEDYRETLRGHRVLHLVGKGNKPATMPITVPVLRVMQACRGERTEGPLILRPLSGKPIDRRDVYRIGVRVARAAGIRRHISPHSLRDAAITNALDAGVPLRDAQILAGHADPCTTEHYDRASGNLDRHGVHVLTTYVAGYGNNPSDMGKRSAVVVVELHFKTSAA